MWLSFVLHFSVFLLSCSSPYEPLSLSLLSSLCSVCVCTYVCVWKSAVSAFVLSFLCASDPFSLLALPRFPFRARLTLSSPLFSLQYFVHLLSVSLFLVTHLTTVPFRSLLFLYTQSRGRRALTGYLLAKTERVLESNENSTESECKGDPIEPERDDGADESDDASPSFHSSSSVLALVLEEEEDSAVAEMPTQTNKLYFEFHVIFSPAYCVPELLFTVTTAGRYRVHVFPRPPFPDKISAFDETASSLSLRRTSL